MNELKDYVDFRLTHSDKLADADGYPLELSDCKKHKPMRDLKIYGNSFQNGTPSPETPIEVQSVGELVTDEADVNYGKYKIPITVRGKNMAKDIKAIYKSAYAYGEITEDEKECIRFTSGHTCKYTEIIFKENTQYTFSFDCKVTQKPGENVGMTVGLVLTIFYDDGNYKSFYCAKDVGWRKMVITSESNKTISSLGVSSYDHKNYTYVDINTFQIEEGITATEYEPYMGTTTNIFLDEPLRKIGDYTDYIDFKNKRIERNVDKKAVVYPGYSWWKLNIDTEDRLSVYHESMIGINYVGGYQILCELFPYKHWNDVGNSTNLVWCAGVSAGFVISTSLISGYNYAWTKEQKRDTFLKWAESIGLHWYLARKSPIEEPLNMELPKLKAKTTIIEVDTSLAPSNAYGKYIKK